uniref:AIG1-type G domain-containing protein n=1 Tax=Anser cygnoides TaxID=8845 RepID=A0A8B9IK16_ANSCY
LGTMLSPTWGPGFTSVTAPRVPMRLILAGKAGGGKSATGNTLVGERVFESKLSTQPVTVRCKKAQGHWDGEDFTVVDTADIFNPSDASDEVHQEIFQCVRLSSPGPHALLLVTQLGRFTQEDEEAAERLQDIFGADVLGHTIVIFTRAEELAGRSLHDFVSCTDNKALGELIQRCGNRYCGFNNRAAGAERDQQVAELMGMVRCMVQANGGGCYSNEMYLEPDLTEGKVEYHMGRYRTPAHITHALVSWLWAPHQVLAHIDGTPKSCCNGTNSPLEKKRNCLCLIEHPFIRYHLCSTGQKLRLTFNLGSLRSGTKCSFWKKPRKVGKRK